MGRVALDRALAIAPILPGARDENGETIETLDLLAQCAEQASLKQDMNRLIHVASMDVPRLLREITRLRCQE